MAYPADVVIVSGAYMVAIDLEDDLSSADAYHVMTSVFEVGGKRVEASIFINT